VARNLVEKVNAKKIDMAPNDCNDCTEVQKVLLRNLRAFLLNKQ